MTPQRAKSTPASTAGSFAAHERAEGDAELLQGPSVAAIVEELRPDLEFLAQYDHGQLTAGTPAIAEAARALVEAIRAQPGHGGRVAGVTAGGELLAQHGLAVAEHQLALAAILVEAGGEEAELVGLVAALVGGSALG
jgi:hypothetical protein